MYRESRLLFLWFAVSFYFRSGGWYLARVQRKSVFRLARARAWKILARYGKRIPSTFFFSFPSNRRNYYTPRVSLLFYNRYFLFRILFFFFFFFSFVLSLFSFLFFFFQSTFRRSSNGREFRGNEAKPEKGLKIHPVARAPARRDKTRPVGSRISPRRGTRPWVEKRVSRANRPSRRTKSSLYRDFAPDYSKRIASSFVPGSGEINSRHEEAYTGKDTPRLYTG